jgi:hypothetical protein
MSTTKGNTQLIKSRLAVLKDLNGKTSSRIAVAPHNKWTTVAKEKYAPMKSEVSYPKTLDVQGLREIIETPVERHSVKFKPPGYAILSEMINTRIMEDSISESLHKKHIIRKYVMKNKENALIKSRNKLDSMRFNYTFGKADLDDNEKLKAFMTRNLERFRFKRTPLDQELTDLTLMVDER